MIQLNKEDGRDQLYEIQEKAPNGIWKIKHTNLSWVKAEELLNLLIRIQVEKDTKYRWQIIPLEKKRLIIG